MAAGFLLVIAVLVILPGSFIAAYVFSWHAQRAKDVSARRRNNNISYIFQGIFILMLLLIILYFTADITFE